MLSALSDIVITIAVVNLMGVKISASGIVAFLLVIGFSVDTDILLTIKVLKRKEGTVMERIYNAIKIGTLMTISSIAAVAVGLSLSKSEVISQIMLVLLIGLIVDLFTTWIQNVGILRLYLEWKEKHENKN
jgi:preprotein translocase subunit SecF